MSRKRKNNPAVPKLSPDAPASEKQRSLLRMAIQKQWLSPNPFAGEYSKWENLSAGKADQLLASIPQERLGVLERELTEKSRDHFRGNDISRSVGRGMEDGIKQLGHSIDGGIS